MDYKAFLIEKHNHIAQVKLNRPKKANALGEDAWKEFPQVFSDLDADPATRVIILSGEGKHFCSGIDIGMLMTLNPTHIKDEGRKREHMFSGIKFLQNALTAITECRKPVLAAIHGACIGAGLELVLACDMRYASQEATLSLKEVDMGLVADLGGLQRLPLHLPEGVVRELAFTGRKMSADEAHQRGLVNQVYESPEALQKAVFDLAWSIAEKSPLVVRGIKQVMNRRWEKQVKEGLEHVALWNSAMLISDDLAASIQASMTGKKPEFKD